MRKGEPIKVGPEIIGNKAKVKIVKNKVAVPFKNCEIDLIYGKGFDMEAEILEMAVIKDVIHKSGSWYSYGDVKIGQGAEAVKKWLADNPRYKEKILSELKPPKINPETGEVLD